MIDPNCIFCKIAGGQVPATKLLEDEAAVAFLDIGPLAAGHMLLIPKSHYVTLDEMPADAAGAMLRHLPALGAAARKVLRGEGFNVLQNNGRVAHQVIQHVHFHIIPRNSGDAFHFNWPAGAYGPGELEELAGKLRAALKA